MQWVRREANKGKWKNENWAGCAKQINQSKIPILKRKMRGGVKVRWGLNVIEFWQKLSPLTDCFGVKVHSGYFGFDRYCTPSLGLSAAKTGGSEKISAKKKYILFNDIFTELAHSIRLLPSSCLSMYANQSVLPSTFRGLCSVFCGTTKT